MKNMISQQKRYLLSYSYVFFLVSLITLPACLEMTKLIPAAEREKIPGYEPRVFSSRYAGGDLAPEVLFGLDQPLADARQRFLSAGAAVHAQRIQELEDLAKRINENHQDPFLSAFLWSLPERPEEAQYARELEEFNETTLRTNFSTALTEEGETLLIRRQKSELSRSNLPPLGFQVLQPPGTVFIGLGQDFDPEALTAQEAGVREGQSRVVQGWTLVSHQRQLVYARSLQPRNAYQALLECAHVKLRLEENAQELSLSWPRSIVLEMEGNPSTLQIVSRWNVLLVESRETGQQSLSLGPVSDEMKALRSQDYLSARYETHFFDGAQGGFSASLFHEARKLFLFRFFASRRETFAIDHVWSSFQLPQNAIFSRVVEQRTSRGLTRRGFSEEQREFYLSPAGQDGATNPPADKWLTPEALSFLDFKRNQRLDLRQPSVGEGSLHHVDFNVYGSDVGFEYYFRGVSRRATAGDLVLLNEDSLDRVLDFCGALF